MTILGVHHTAIATRELDRLVDFYCGLFGFEKTADDRWAGSPEIDAVVGLPGSIGRQVMLRGHGYRLELFDYSAPAPSTGDPDRRVCDPGLTHIAFRVEEIDGEYDRLRAAGMRFHTPPVRLGPMRATYGRDPDGNVIELIEFDHRP